MSVRRINVKIRPMKKTIIRWDDKLLENKRSDRIKLEKKLNTLNQNVIQNQEFYQNQLKPEQLQFLNNTTNNNVIKNNNKFIYDVDREEKINYDPNILQMTEQEKEFLNIPMEEEIIKPDNDIKKHIKNDLKKFKKLKIDSKNSLFNKLYNYLNTLKNDDKWRDFYIDFENLNNEEKKEELINNYLDIIEDYWNNNYDGLYKKQLLEYNLKMGEKSRKNNEFLQQAYKQYYNRVSNLNNLPFNVNKLPDETDENYYNRMSNIQDYRLSQTQILNNLQDEYKQKLKQYLYENTNLSLTERIINHSFFKDPSKVKIIVDTIKNFDKKLKKKYSQIDFDTFMLFSKNYVENIDNNDDEIGITSYTQFNMKLLDDLRSNKILNHYDEIDRKLLLEKVDKLENEIKKKTNEKGFILKSDYYKFDKKYNDIYNQIKDYINRKKGTEHIYNKEKKLNRSKTQERYQPYIEPEKKQGEGLKKKLTNSKINIIKGQILAGNDNKILKNELKKLIKLKLKKKNNKYINV